MRLQNFKLISSIMAFMIYSIMIIAQSEESKNIKQSEFKKPAKGIYTSILEINNNTPKHALDLDIRKYNSVDVYYIKKAKLRLLKDVLAISDGKDLYITLGSFRNKTGFVKTEYSNWNLEYKMPAYGEASNTTFKMEAGYYKSYYLFKKPDIVDSTIQLVQKGKKAIYQLANNQSKQLNGIAAACDGKHFYLKIGRYHNKPAFAKSAVQGKFCYFEVEPAIINEDKNFATYGGLSGLANAYLSKEFSSKEKIGILVNSKNNKLFVLGNYKTFKSDAFTNLIKKYPKLLIEFLRSKRKSDTLRNMVFKINNIHNQSQP